MKRKIERDPAAFEFVEDRRAERKFKKLKRIVNKLARDVKKNPDDPEFKTLFKKAAAELNAYVQTEYKKHSKKLSETLQKYVKSNTNRKPLSLIIFFE